MYINEVKCRMPIKQEGIIIKIENEKYSIQLIPEKKMVKICTEGFFKEEDVKKFMQDYSRLKEKADSSYSLIVDPFNFKTVRKDLRNQLEQTLKMYNKDFSDLYCIEPKSAATRLQITKLAKKNGIEYTFIESGQEDKEFAI